MKKKRIRINSVYFVLLTKVISQIFKSYYYILIMWQVLISNQIQYEWNTNKKIKN